MSLTITIPGAVNVTTGAMAPAVLTIGVGVPGAAGPAGPAGPGVPAGGTAGQYLQKIDGVNYNTDWVTLNLGAYAPLNSPLFTGDPRGPTAALGDNDTSLATTAFVQQELLSGTANARNLEVYVRNQTGSTIPAGSIVYINGATGNRPTITLAQANNDANSAQTFGFTKAAIANNGFGYVIVRGECEALDTSSLTEGVQLYLSPTTPGTWTTTKPSAPQHLVYVGICVRAHPTQGVIMVAVQNGYELPELHDVSITSVANNDLLAYESSSTLWKNKSFGTLGLLTSSSLTGYATQSFVAANYAPIAAGLPVSGTVGQVLTKNSGTNYDASWQTLIPGDRYLTTSTSSVTIGLGSKSLTVGTGLSYSGQQDVVISFDASNHMHALVTSYNSGTGALVVNVQSFSGSGTYTAWTVNVGGTTPLQSVEWGEILGTLGDQTDLATALNGKLESTTAASTYAALAGATFTGEVITPASTTSNAGLTITPGVAPTSPINGEIWATTNDLQVRLNGVTETLAEQSWVTAQGYLTSAPVTSVAGRTGAITLAVGDVSGAAALAGATFTGLVNTLASSTAGAGFRLPHGAAPTTPTDGDLFTTTSGLFARINGTTRQYVDFDGTQTITGNKTFSNANQTLGSSTATGTINVASGATISGSTKTVNIGTGGVSGSTTTITIGSGNGTTTTFNGTLNAGGNVSLGTFTGATTVNLANGATTTGLTKTVNVGTGGLAGSTTTIAIGSTAGTSTTTLQGTTNGITAAADTNSVALATTAFVVGQAGSATPIVDGTATVGTSLRYARQDHVHPTDTTRAPLASPTFTGTVTIPAGASISGFAPLASPSLTGTPTSTTAAVDTNTTQIATTAFVVAQASAATPLVDGTAAVGTSLRYARADHVHPTDTSRAALNSPAFTGTPSLPTGTTAVTQTAGNNTTAVATTAFVTAAVPAAATHLQSLQFASSTAFTRVVDASSQLIAPSSLRIWPTPSNFNGTATSGAGASASGTLSGYRLISPSAGVAGNARAFHANVLADAEYLMWGGSSSGIIDFSRRVSMAFRFAQFPSDANSVTRVLLGKIHGTGAGDLSSRGIGVRYTLTGGNGQFTLQVHNGTTLTNVVGSTNYAGGVADIEVLSDGAGNATLFLNGSSIATTNQAPTAATATFATVFAEVESQVTTTSQAAANIGRLYVNSNNF